jgi:hypothetical protein
MSHSISDVKFFSAGNAIFTIANNKGEHYTYRIKHKPAKGSYRESWFMSLLTGPQNTSDYTYLGLFDPKNLKVILTRASKFTNESRPVKVAEWAFMLVKEGKAFPEGYSLQHEGKCCRCARLLTDPISIQLGIGPECRKQMPQGI